MMYFNMAGSEVSSEVLKCDCEVTEVIEDDYYEKCTSFFSGILMVLLLWRECDIWHANLKLRMKE